MKFSYAGAATLAVATVFATPAAAQSAPPVVQTPPAKPVSPFVLCDGRTGYVSGGLRIFRALAVMGTLGVSELGTTKDDDSKRAKGKDGAAACTTALTLEKNGERRVELVMAKTIHLLEDNDLDQALATIRTAEEAAGDYKQDVGFRRTLLPRAMLLEANVHLRAKRYAEAEAKVVEALQLGAYDVAFVQRAYGFLVLTNDLGPAKLDVLAQSARMIPINFSALAQTLCANGRYLDAAQLYADYVTLATASLKKFTPIWFDANQSLLLALAGDAEKSNALRAKVETEIARLRSSGESGDMSELLAQTSETLTLQSVIIDLKQGKASDARATFRAHGPWLLADKRAVYASMQQLRAGAPASELTGTLSETPDAWRGHFLDEMAKGIATEDQTKRLYALPTLSASAAEFAKASRVTWTTGAKPKFLWKPDKKDPALFEFMSTLDTVSATGLPAGEALLLQAALIARERGLDGVALIPTRRNIDLIGVRFGKIGTPGFPESLTFPADKLIADLTPVIPKPTPTN